MTVRQLIEFKIDCKDIIKTSNIKCECDKVIGSFFFFFRSFFFYLFFNFFRFTWNKSPKQCCEATEASKSPPGSCAATKY